MSKVDLSIIIVSYNTRDFTIKCIESVVKSIHKISYEIIVVDNASSDDSVEALEGLKIDDERLKIIANPENFGFSKANNIGVGKSSGRMVLFLNSDTLVYEKTLDGMVEFMDKNPEVGASTCFVRMPNGKLDDAAHRGFPTPARALSHFSGLSKLLKFEPFSGYNLKHLKHDSAHEIEALAGAFMMVRREAGEQVKWWDEDYFFYGEDIDFCYKLAQKDWKIYFVPEFEILHYKGVSGGIKKDSSHLTQATIETKKRAQKARHDAMRIFYRKHYEKRYPKILTKLVFAGIGLREFLVSKHS